VFRRATPRAGLRRGLPGSLRASHHGRTGGEPVRQRAVDAPFSTTGLDDFTEERRVEVPPVHPLLRIRRRNTAG
jgi:hypothetical protein